MTYTTQQPPQGTESVGDVGAFFPGRKVSWEAASRRRDEMRIVYFARRISASGGMKVLAQHVRLLRKRGFDAAFLTLRNDHSGLFEPSPVVIDGVNSPLFRGDVFVATKPSDVALVFRSVSRGAASVCHLCQGDEIGDLHTRLRALLGWRTAGASVMTNLPVALKLYRRLRRFQRVYRLPTHKMAVSRHLCRAVENRFSQPCFRVRNGIDPSVFFQPEIPLALPPEGLWRLVSVGPLGVKTKGIEHVMAAVGFLKKDGYAIHLTRISGTPMTAFEKQSGLVDEYLQSIPERAVAEALQRSHALLAGSSEAEGFGLPLLEAMACGTPCVATRISAHLGLDEGQDYAHFVEPGQPHQMAEGVIRLMTDADYRLRIVARGLEVARAHSLQGTEEDLVSFLSGLTCRVRRANGVLGQM